MTMTPTPHSLAPSPRDYAAPASSSLRRGGPNHQHHEVDNVLSLFGAFARCPFLWRRDCASDRHACVHAGGEAPAIGQPGKVAPVDDRGAAEAHLGQGQSAQAGAAPRARLSLSSGWVPTPWRAGACAPSSLLATSPAAFPRAAGAFQPLSGSPCAPLVRLAQHSPVRDVRTVTAGFRFETGVGQDFPSAASQRCSDGERPTAASRMLEGKFGALYLPQAKEPVAIQPYQADGARAGGSSRHSAMRFADRRCSADTAAEATSRSGWKPRALTASTLAGSQPVAVDAAAWREHAPLHLAGIGLPRGDGCAKRKTAKKCRCGNRKPERLTAGNGKALGNSRYQARPASSPSGAVAGSAAPRGRIATDLTAHPTDCSPAGRQLAGATRPGPFAGRA